LALRGPSGTISVTQTDLSGRYTFPGLAPGAYLLVAGDTATSQLIMTYPVHRATGLLARDVLLGASSVTGIDLGLHRPDDLPVFVGSAFVNATPSVFPDVRAFVGGVDCTFPASVLPTDFDPSTYQISVLSSELLDGCADPSDKVTFTVNGLPANESATWEPVSGPFLELELTVGPPFAATYIGAFMPGNGVEPRRQFGPVVALVDGNVCGTGAAFLDFIMIPPRELVAGCAYEGAVVRFAVTGLLAEEYIIWRGGLRADVELTIVPAQSPAMAGPAFAYFRLELPAGAGATATIGDTHCGSAASSEESGLAVVAVAPDQLDKGCGYEGAPVKINVYQRGVIVAQVDAVWLGGQFRDIEWHARPAGADSRPISPPTVGDAGLRR
jgi:hypothetical protein